MKNFTTKTLARAGVTAGLYVGLTMLLLPVSFGPVQIRLSEGLMFLPAFFPESVFSLFIGCAAANLFSAYGVYDIVIGSLTTLAACFLTRIIYKKTENFILAGIPPVLLNAIFIPVVFYLSGATEGYFINFVSIFISEAASVYVVGIPIAIFIKKEKEKGNKLFSV